MKKMFTENHCTAQISSLWGVALRPWCGHCPAHSHLGQHQCYASQAVSAFRMSDTKQQSTTGRENVAIHCVREEGHGAATCGQCKFSLGTEKSVSS